MPGMRQATPGGLPRLSDRVAIGVLTRTYPPALVDQVLARTGRAERRHRLLPARLVVYYVLALALFAGVAYEEVLRCLVEGLGGAPWWPNPREPWRVWRVPAKSALVQARARLGAAPLRVLFEQAARPLATTETQGAFYRGLRLVALDGTCLDVADTPANAAALVGLGPAAVRAWGPSRRSGWSPWPSAAPTPSPRWRSGPAPPGSSLWPHRWWRGWDPGCWRWPTGAC
jgi:Insertion element 4 transposase N-terminal